MAISLSIQRKGQPENAETVPVATLAVFDQYWAPAVRDLNLRWVPLFRTGIPVQPEDVDPIVGELKILRRSMAALPGQAPEIVLPRIDRLISELESTGSDPDIELYIG